MVIDIELQSINVEIVCNVFCVCVLRNRTEQVNNQIANIGVWTKCKEGEGGEIQYFTFVCTLYTCICYSKVKNKTILR